MARWVERWSSGDLWWRGGGNFTLDVNRRATPPMVALRFKLLFPECAAKGSRSKSGGLGAGPLFASSVSSGRRRVGVASSSGRRRVVNSVSMGEAAKHLLFEGFQAGCHVVLRGRRGTL